jgi:hypothetical protein
MQMYLKINKKDHSHTVPVKFGHLFKGFDLLFSTLQNNSEDVWNHGVTKKSVKQIKIYLRFFEVATLCLDSFAHSTFNQLRGSHLECVSNCF